MSVGRQLALAWALACALACAPSSEGEGEGEGDASEGEGEGEELGDGQDGDVCAFNRECAGGLRCACDGACACEPGARGTGVNGVDACVDGNDCASSVCVEDSDGGFTCSGECVDDADCAERLPICSDIAFVGRICIRDPNG